MSDLVAVLNELADRNIIFMSFAFAAALFVFYRQYLELKGGRKKAEGQRIGDIESQVNRSLEKRLGEIESRLLNSNSRDQVDKRIQEVIQNLSLDQIFKGRESQIWERFNQGQFAKCIELIQENMESYRDANRQQYARNLTAGLGLSAFAVLVALYLVINRPSINMEEPYFALIQVLISYVPYITVIIVVEVLAFFFLKLYKQNVEVERYIRNEISSLNAKLAAIFVAMRSEDEAFRQTLVARLFDIERNQVLENGATTIEIEKARLDVESFKDGLDFFASAVPANVLNDAMKATSSVGKK